MKDNKLLAEYLGLKTISNNMYIHGIWVWNHDGTELIKYNPDTDWNQLMMVVEKIHKEIEGKGAFLKGYYNQLFLTGLLNVKTEAVYNACVEYVNSQS